MNNWNGTGRLVRDPEIRQAGESKVAKVTIAVPRRFTSDNQPDADFIKIEVWGKRAEFLEKYFTKGMKAEVIGEIQTNTYTDKDGKTVYDWHVRASQFDFAESKKSDSDNKPSQQASGSDGFMSIPTDSPEELPFQ